jgi:hypothetical protein
MKLSEDTIQVLEFLDYTSSNTLRKRNDLGVILEVLATNNLPDLANDIIFYGAALWNTFKTFKKNPSNEGTSKLVIEIENLFNKMENFLMTITEFVPEDDIIERFNKVYLKGESGSRMNIIDLSYDLNELKKVQIQMKRK